MNSSQTRENTDKQGLNLNEAELTVISERKESEISKSEDEIAYMRKLKDLTTKEKELNKREKTLRKKEYDTEHLSQQLTTAKALVASLENKVLDIRKENDNLKTHLLASNSISHSNIGNIQPQMGSSQMEMNLTVRLQAIENELLRMRLDMQDTAGNTGMKCNPCERNNFSEDKIKFLESRISILESENRHLGNRLSDTVLKLKINENDLRLRQAVVTPSYFHTGYNLQYMPAPTNKQTVINTKTENAKVNSKFQKGYVTKQKVPGRSPTSTKVKSVSDSYQDKANGENDCNESVICMEDSGEIRKRLNRTQPPIKKRNVINRT